MLLSCFNESCTATIQPDLSESTTDNFREALIDELQGWDIIIGTALYACPVCQEYSRWRALLVKYATREAPDMERISDVSQ